MMETFLITQANHFCVRHFFHVQEWLLPTICFFVLIVVSSFRLEFVVMALHIATFVLIERSEQARDKQARDKKARECAREPS